MEMQDIRYFLAMSRTLNFTKAADVCHVTQPALTRAIRKMEDELGGLLFSREPNNTHMTDLGPADSTPSDRNRGTRRRGKTDGDALPHAGGSEFRTRHHVHDRTSAVRQLFEPLQGRQPWRRDHAVGGRAGPALRSIDEGRAGCRVDGSRGRLSGASSGFETLFRTVRDCLLHGPSVCHEERNSHGRARRGDLLLQRVNCGYHDVLDELCREHGANPVKSYQSEREDWILTMVAAGMGVCFLPEYTATFPGVVGCPVVEPSVERNVCLVSVAGRRWSSPVAAFVQAVRRHPWPSASVARDQRETNQRSTVAA